MAIASLTHIEKTFGQRVLFDRLNFTVDRGERVGLIGVNGAGKSTLFKMLAREIEPDAGSVELARGSKAGYLEQDPVLDPSRSVIDEAATAFASLHAQANQLHDIEHKMAETHGQALETLLHRYETLQHAFSAAGGYAWEHRLEGTLQGIGLAESTWQQPVSTLSGGQRSRLALAKLLIAEPDLLLLDEPTNHLDLTAIEWLEDYLLGFSGAVVMVSHDRYLLDRLATRIAWLHQERVDSFPGNYSAFVEQRDLQELTQQRQYQRQQADIDKQKEFVRRFGAGQRSKEAKGREKRLNRLLVSDTLVRQVESSSKIRLNLGTEQRAGDRVLRVTELAKAFDERVLFDALAFEIDRGDRIGIIGPNGSGKTTLLRCLLGITEPDAGEVRWGANLRLGYYDQRLDDFDPDLSVYETTLDGREATDNQIRNVLGAMLFTGDDVFKSVGLLSGGERARVRFAQLLLDKPNVLLLDEPTNHLDIASAQALERALADYPGTILCVSHDRYFLDHVVSRLLVLESAGASMFEGSYTRWHQRQVELAAQAAAAKAQRKSPAPKSPPKKPASKQPAESDPYRRPFGRLSVAQLEQEILQTETDLADVQLAMSGIEVARDPDAARQRRSEYDSLAKRLKQLEQEYFARGT